MRKLRLLITEECNRNCPGCCNKDWDLSTLPIETDFTGYDEILITGGEPMLEPQRVMDVATAIRIIAPYTKIYMYTAKTEPVYDILEAMLVLDGITVTLHVQHDVQALAGLDHLLAMEPDLAYKSLRLNVFNDITLCKLQSPWVVKRDMVWIPNCPLPENEVFKKLA